MNQQSNTRSSKSEPRVNDQIRSQHVRVIGDDGSQLGQMSIDEARRIADNAGLDIIEISPDAKPPVVKITDYGKWRYNKEKSENKKHKDKKTTKEVRFSMGIGEHDLKTKMKMVEKFLAQGDNVLVKIIMRGRENAHQDIGLQRMNSIVDMAKGMYKSKSEVKLERNIIQCMFFA